MRTVLTAPYALNRSLEGSKGEGSRRGSMSRTALLPSRTIGTVLGENETLKVFKRQSAKMIPMAGKAHILIVVSGAITHSLNRPDELSLTHCLA